DEVPSSRAARGEEFDDVLMWSGDDPRTRRAVSVTARHAENESGAFIGAALAGTDVTDLMRAMEVKDEFVALVSHELRTPLTSIVGYVSMLHERDDLPEIALKQLGVVARSADRLRILVDDLLEAAQVTSNGLSLDPAPLDLASIVAEAIASARPHAAGAGIALGAELPTQVGLVGDQVRLAQVVDNLVSNAIKYTPRGGSVHVTLDERADAVELVVRDTGMGIAPDDLEQVFNRFFRTQQAADQAIRGVGLGLAITKQIIEGHGGAIQVASELGRGSEFRVVLPVEVVRLAS
ncbi:sensor histidine kinase, partial [Nocardioides hankookensis]